MMSENHDSQMSAASDLPPPYQPQAHTPGTLISAQQDEPARSAVYYVYRSRFGNYKLLRDNRTPTFYVNSRSIRDPDLIVHRGNGDYDREVANCTLPSFNPFYCLNLLREVNNRSSAVQTKMTLAGRFTGKIRFQDSAGATNSTERSFIWKRTPSMTLIDMETNQTTAVMHEMSYGLKLCFVLEIQEKYGQGFEILAVSSAMAVYESQRRESSSPSTNHHHFGTGAGRLAASRVGFGGLTGAMMGGSASGGGGF